MRPLVSGLSTNLDPQLITDQLNVAPPAPADLLSERPQLLQVLLTWSAADSSQENQPVQSGNSDHLKSSLV